MKIEDFVINEDSGQIDVANILQVELYGQIATSDVQIRIQGFFSWIRIQTSKRRIRIRIQEKMGGFGFGFESGFGPLLVSHNFIKNLLL